MATAGFGFLIGVLTGVLGVLSGGVGADRNFLLTQPQFRVENGHLFIEGPRNITINAGLSLNVQGQDLDRVVNMMRAMSPRLDDFRGPGGPASRLQMARLAGLTEDLRAIGIRVRHLEAAVGNSTGGGRLNTTQRNSVNRRLRAVERRLRTLERTLMTNECASNPCMHGGACEDVYNGFICRCPAGWEGTVCELDVDECARLLGTDLGCQNEAVCVNTPGSYRCNCKAGFFGTHCMQQSYSCAAGNDLCGNGVCVQKGASDFSCICSQGWRQDPATRACTVDEDECAASRPACSHDPPVPCINLPGSFRCGSCPQGFAGNGYYCTDVDECLVNNGGCSVSPSVQCINTRGSSVCGPCPPGYVGDGRSCSFQGVCNVNNGGCHPLATCIHLPGSGQSVYCVCMAGYAGSGVGPQGCFPANTTSAAPSGPCASSPCRNGAACTNSAGSYTCTCRPGFKGRDCETADPCSSSPCQNGGTCIKADADFTCDCPDGFTGERCETRQDACGGFLRSEAGTLRFPHSNNSNVYPHGVNCGWVIITNTSMVLNVTFTHFEVEDGTQCNYDWLQIHDGPTSGSHQIGRFCGLQLPKDGHIMSTHNSLYLWFRADSSIAKRGFELHWTSVKPECGSLIELESHASISSPGSPGKYPANRDCYWVVMAPPGRRVQLHFFSMQIENHPNCSFDFLEVRDGLDSDSPLLARYCNSSHVPAPLVGSGNTLTLYFHSDASGQDGGFQIAASATEGTPGCGGVLTEPSGVVTAPKGADGNYRSNMDCGWKIQVPVSERISIEFEDEFDIEQIDGCMFDYLEIYDGPDQNAPVVGKFCRTKPPRVVSSSNTMFVFFHTDTSYQKAGFTFRYEVECGGVFTELQGAFSSPYYPNPYPMSRRCVYEIRLAPKTAVSLEFQDFDVEDNSGNGCFYDSVTVRDGYDTNATAIGTYCGMKADLPDHPLVSTHNNMFIEFVTDNSLGGRGFRANYSAIDLMCGGILKDRHGLIESPRGSDGNHPSDAKCSWLLVAPPGHVVQLTFVSLVLEKTRECDFDYVAVYDNSTVPGMGGLLGRFCGKTIPPVMTSTDSVMNVVFRSDSSLNKEGFTATYTFLDQTKVCGAKFLSPSGVVSSPNYPNNYPSGRDCVYSLRVPNGQQIRLNFTDFDLEDSHNCNWDSIEIRNGGSERSPLVGKYCGTKAPPVILSITNELSIRFKSDTNRAGRGFRFLWDSASQGCGGTLSASSGTIHSPNYPQPYGNRAECYWSIAVAHGSVVKVMFTDLELETSTRCIFDYVELWDGLPTVGKQLGRYCSGRPDPVVSKTNHMYVRFHSDAMFNSRGFALDYESTCQANLTGLHGVLESPNWPNAPPRRADCMWTVTVPRGNTINITFSHIGLELPFAIPGRGFYRLGQFRGGRPTWGRAFVTPSTAAEIRDEQYQSVLSCNYIYVLIRDSQKDPETDEESPGPELGRFCGSKLPPMVASKTNKVYVSFNSPTFSPNSGFRLEWVSEGCGGELRRPEGAFTSPNYPTYYPTDRVCEWTIVGDWGTSIELTIWDMSMEHVPNCVFDSISVYGGPDDTAPRLANLCHTEAKPITYTSSSRYMFVRFVTDHSFSGRGFNASYRRVDGRCGGRLTAPYGQLNSPGYPKNYGPADDCVWNIEVAEGHSVRLTLEDLDIDYSRNCSSDYLKVVDGPSLEDDGELLRLCGSRIPENRTTVTSKANTMTVRMKSDGTRTAKGFRASYATVCGAFITVTDGGVISSHEAINMAGDNANCTWTLVAADAGQHVTLTITQLVVSHLDEEGETEQCVDNNHLEVWEGLDNSGQLLGRYCTSHLPRPITSRGAALHVNLVSPHNTFHGWFSAAYSVLSNACGGTYNAERGSIASPGYPDSYAPGVECEWTIKSAPGNRVQLAFSAFNLVASQGCVDDYLEVREEHALGAVIGVFCGSDAVPTNVSSSKSLWIKFRSDDADTAPGFLADFALAHGDLNLSGPEGQIASPLYPSPYAQNADLQWRITATAATKVISITIKDLNTDYFSEDCEMVYLAVYDGVDETAPKLFKGCGGALPPPMTTTSNVAFVRLYTHPIRRASAFLLQWREVARNAETVVEASAGDKCGAAVHLPAGGKYNFTSPGYPAGYGQHLNCTWVLDTDPGWHLAIFFNDMDLEVTPGCVLDRVLVSTGEGGGPNWKLQYTLCLPNVTYNSSLVATNFMLVNFLSDWGVNGTGFAATVYSVCGGELRGPSGVITAPNDTTIAHMPRVEPSCEWVVTARQGRTLAVSFLDLDISPEAGEGQGPETCGNSYVLLKNGGSAASPLLGDGKYCGRGRPTVPETTGNQLYVRYRAHQPNTRFVLRYDQKSGDCSREIRLLDSGAAERIATPNHPNIPNPHTECVWLVMAPPGRRVRMDFDGRFDVSSSTSSSSSCVKSAVELRDGATESAALIGTFCSTLPSTQESTGNVLRVRYFNDEALPGNGFTANVSVATCGGTIRGASGTITSPGYPGHYPPSTRCEWRLVVSPTATMTLSFKDLHVYGNSRLCMDNVTVTSMAKGGFNDTDVILGSFCGIAPPANVTSLGNEVKVVFQSGPRGLLQYRGFSLQFSSNKEVCGGTLEMARGTIRSPGYPSKVPRQRCVWTIKAPEGRRITITFKDVDLSPAAFPRYNMQRIWLYHGLEETVPMRNLNYTLKQGTSFESTSNSLVVVLYSLIATNNRGFVLDFDTDKPVACGAPPSTAVNGTLDQPTDAGLESFLCSWRLDAPPDGGSPATSPTQTLAVRVSRLQLPGTVRFPCHRYSTRVLVQETDGTAVTRLCGPLKEPVTIVSPYMSNMVVASHPWYERSMNFTMDYRWYKCGGVLENPVELTSPGYPASYPANMHCAWKIVFDEGKQALVTFERVDLRSCDDVLEVHNGDSRTSPKLGPFCQRADPLHSSGRHLWVEFHSGPDKPGKSGGAFKLSFATDARACGGILHGTSGTFSSPGFPRGYADNVECSWEVRAERGYRVSLRFVERFNIQQRDNCTGDHLEVVDYDEEAAAWRSVRRLCGRTPLADGETLLSSGARLRLIFRSDGSGSAEGFKAAWGVACGFKRTLTPARPRGEVLSPGFPVGYAANLNCSYELLAPGRVIQARFTNFSVETAKTCQYDNVTIIRQFDEDPTVPYNSDGGYRTVHCDHRQPPAELRVSNRLYFTFQTDRWVQQQGFRLEYHLDDCDEDITTPAEIRSPSKDGQYTNTANCTYNVTAPPGHVVAIRFSSFVVEMSFDCFSDSLAVYDGATANESAILGRFCGNLTANLPRLQSTGRSLLLRWQTDSSITAAGFVAHVWFFSGNCGTVSRSGSGNTESALAPASALQLGVGESLVISMKHPLAFQHCDWSLTAPDGYTVSVTVDSVALLAPCPNATLHHRDACSCSYLELADGLTQFSTSMGKFCRAQPPPRLTSSDRSVLVRLVAGPAEAQGTLVIRAAAVRSVCGPSTFRLNENITELVLNSPGFPSTPPAAVRCQWVVETQYSVGSVNVTTLDLNGPAQCRGHAFSTGRLDIYKGAGGTWSSRNDTHIGRQLGHLLTYPGMTLDAYTDPSPHSFCDNKRPPVMNFGLFTQSITIVYSSGERPVGKGFQLRVVAGKGCPAAEMAEPSGNVWFPSDKLSCKVRITAPANSTVTFVMTDTAYVAESTNCVDGGVQLFDGRETTSPSLGTVCGSDMRRAFSSTGPNLLINYWKKDDNMYSNVEGWYYTTDQGPGCGGSIHRESGHVASPMYPAPYRNSSTCRWDIEVPGARNPVLQFKVFDLGPNALCATDYIKVFDVDVDGSEQERGHFCDQTKPSLIRGATHRLAIKYTTSALNGGTGWFAEFIGLGSGEHFPGT
ncbi:cubilin [Thrips palmi]|uniref:Cubilin n=1 Tax=Thrips palmi TaxID=161013 RepID=A0A6P8YXW9_THRPL|nr:cubilin [Thrips palmi]